MRSTPVGDAGRASVDGAIRSASIAGGGGTRRSRSRCCCTATTAAVAATRTAIVLNSLLLITFHSPGVAPMSRRTARDVA